MKLHPSDVPLELRYNHSEYVLFSHAECSAFRHEFKGSSKITFWTCGTCHVFLDHYTNGSGYLILH